MPAATARSLSVAVIGAGAAGLVTTRELLREGHSVTTLEQSGSIGGIWDYHPECEEDLLGRNPKRKRVHSSMYASLRTNLPRQVMSFSDFPCTPEAMQGRSKDSRRFPHHTEIQAWLEVFAQEFGVLDVLHLHQRVVRVEPLWAADQADCCSDAATVDAGPRWRVTTESAEAKAAPWSADAAVQQPTVQSAGASAGPQATASQADDSCQLAVGKGQQTRVFDAVVSCVGNYHQPNLPQVTGMDTWVGLQMHCHNYRAAARFQGQIVVVVGSSFSGVELARAVADVARQVFHSARSWTVEQQAVQERRLNLQQVAMLAELRNEGRTAVFADGLAVQGVDAVLYCTGYQYVYPWLLPDGPLRTTDMRVDPLFKHIFPPAVAPTLAFVGLLWKSIRNPQFELQAKLVARVLSGRSALPGRKAMQADVEAFYSLLQAEGVPRRYTHCQAGNMPIDQWTYNAWLADACGSDVPHPPEWRKNLAKCVVQPTFCRPDTFRDVWSDDMLSSFAAGDAACAAMWQEHLTKRTANAQHAE